jgi:hypothetical protein
MYFNVLFLKCRLIAGNYAIQNEPQKKEWREEIELADRSEKLKKAKTVDGVRIKTATQLNRRKLSDCVAV